MMDKNDKILIGDLTKVTDYVANGSFASLKENVSYDYKKSFAVLIRLVDFKSNWNGPFVYVDESSYKFLKKSSLEVGDLIISNVGAYAGTVFRAPNLELPITLGPNSIVLKDLKCSDFWYYYFSSTIGQNQIDSIKTGSAQPKFNKTDFRKLQVPNIPITKQRAIASLLGALDDKIQNNHQINETLEEMARTIYKSWFVDFDPVHAKVAGNAPAHMDTETAALFPSSFGDDGLPVGWQYKKLEDISDLSWGDLKTTKKSYVETGFDAYSASGKDGMLPHFDFEKLGIVISAIGANCGNTWLARGKWSCIKNTIRFWSKYDLTPTIFLYHVTKGNNFWPIRGSAQPFISQGDARSQKIIVPANGEAISFEKIVGDFYEKISAYENENQTLAKLRDTLLPKLMSGEIRVKDAEREVEATV